MRNIDMKPRLAGIAMFRLEQIKKWFLPRITYFLLHISFQVRQALAECQPQQVQQHGRHLLCIRGTVMEDFLIFAILVVTYSGVWAWTSMPLEANSAPKPMENLQGSLPSKWLLAHLLGFRYQNISRFLTLIKINFNLLSLLCKKTVPRPCNSANGCVWK